MDDDLYDDELYWQDGPHDNGGMDPMMAGMGYAFYRHGQDRQTEQLISALGGRRDVDGEAHPHIPLDEREDIPFINALDYATQGMPDSWDDYIGQEPMKRQIGVYMKSAQARNDRFPHTLLASGFPGVGKGSPLSTKVATPSGWRTIGSLKIGDAIIGSNGKTTHVTGVYDRGVLPTFRVTMTDGSSVTVDGDHLWRVSTPKQRTRGTFRVKSTRELMAEGLQKKGKSQHFIPMVQPVEFASRHLPVDPYLTGVLLGNADFVGGIISLNQDDADIADRIRSRARNVDLRQTTTHTALRYRPLGARKLLEALGQYGISSAEKYVPSIYLTAQLEDRREILAGLMDTDGSVRTDRGSAQFHTTSPRLAEDVQTLVESLGGTARIMHATRGEIRVDIAISENPFRSTRKASQWRPGVARHPLRAIASIEPAGDAEVRCISVAADDQLYVTERFIVTHNTTLARLIAKTMGVKMVELVPPFNIFTLVQAASELSAGDILFIDEIHKLADNGKRGAEILLKVLEDHVAFLPTGEVVDLDDITVIGATTDRDKLPEPVIDRFKVKPFFQPYSLGELARITITFASKHDALDMVDDDLAVAIAKACRGTPRITEEFVIAARDLHMALGRRVAAEELLDFVEVEPDGLGRQHIQYLTSLRQFFPRTVRDTEEIEYVVGEAAMQQILRETKQGLGRIENFLIEKGYIDRTPRGRRLTNKGIARAEEFIAAGKGASSAA